jgi:hypothetical protein
MPAGALAPDGSPWTLWYYPPRGHAQMLVRAVGQAWAPAYALTLYGVQGCNYAGVADGLPTFEVPGHGVQALSLEQALACNIVRMPQSEAEGGGVRRRDPR